MPEQRYEKPSAVDPGRQMMIGMMLLMLFWFGYCSFIWPQQRPTPTPSETVRVCPNGHSTDTSRMAPDIAKNLRFCPECGAPFDGTHAPPPTQPPQTQTQPAAIGSDPAVTPTPTDPAPTGDNGVPPANGEPPPPATPGQFAFPPPITPTNARLFGGARLDGTYDERFETPLMRPVFSDRGAGIHELVLRGYHEQTGADHSVKFRDDTHILRPFDPDRLSYSVELSGHGMPSSNYLATARWELTAHDIQPDPAHPTVRVHTVVFQWPPRETSTPTDADAAPVPAPFGVTKTFMYRDDSYAIDVWVTVENRTTRAWEIQRPRINGLMGMPTGYFPPEDHDSEVYFAVNPEKNFNYVRNRTDGTVESESLAGQTLMHLNMGSVFPDGYIRSSQSRYRNLVVTPGEPGEAVRWLGQSVMYFHGAMFAPTAPPGQRAPRVARAVAEPYRSTNREALEADINQRWVVLNYFDLDALAIPAGESRTVGMRAYAGPKVEAHLAAVNLQEMVKISYSAVEWIAAPLLGILNFFQGLLSNWGIAGAWGIAIVCLTLVVRLVLLPLSYWSQLKMQESMAGIKRVQPKIEKLQKKYKDNRPKLQQEMAKLYREEGVPLGGMFQGCLLMLLQMPIWIALFGAFRYDIDFLGADFLWINDLSKPDALLTIAHVRLLEDLPLIGPFFANMLTPAGVLHLNILPILVMSLMYYQTMMTQKMQTATLDPEQQRQQKMMMGCMFIMFFFLFYRMAAGFNLYFLASTTYALVETRFLKKAVQRRVEEKYPPLPDAAAAAAESKKPDGKKPDGKK